jgi:hypothetical protein
MCRSSWQRGRRLESAGRAAPVRLDPDPTQHSQRGALVTKTPQHDATDTYFGVSLILTASILVPGLVAMFLTDDFWLIVAAMAVGAFVGLVIQARIDKRSRR